MRTRSILAFCLLALILGFAVALLWQRPSSGGVGDPQTVQSAAHLVRPHSPVLGTPQAPVTVVEFFDPSCEGCRAFHPFVKQILAEFAGRVRVVIRYAPFHEGSDEAVAVLEAARDQGIFERVLEALLERQPDWAVHGAPNLDLAWKIAAQAGLNIEPARRQAAAQRAREILALDVADLNAVGIEKTPTFYVNGRPLSRFHPDELRSLVQREVERSSSASKP